MFTYLLFFTDRIPHISFYRSVLAEIAFFLLFPPSCLFKLGGNVTFSLFPSRYSLNKSSAVTSF